MEDICRDLASEHELLDDILSGLDDDGWKTVTPFFDWTVHDEVVHIAYFDYTARLAATDEEAFAAAMKEMIEVRQSGQSLEEMSQNFIGGDSDADLMENWRRERAALLAGLLKRGKKDRIPWYGPSMSALSFATARLMETWAHSQDILDAMGLTREPTDRLKHIAHLGVTTFGWTYANRKMDVPTDPVRIELISPSGELWTWGPEDASNKVTGHAEDFCLVVTQRRNVADTYLKVTGDTAASWMSMCQAFAGPPEDNRPAGMFPKIER